MPSAEVFGVCLKIPYSQISWHANHICFPLFFSASLFSDGGCNPLFQLYTPFIFHIFHGIPIKVTDLPSKPRFFMVNSDFWLVKSLKHLETLIEILEILHFFGRNLPRKLLRPQSLRVPSAVPKAPAVLWPLPWSLNLSAENHEGKSPNEMELSMGKDIPSGYLTVCHGKSPCY